GWKRTVVNKANKFLGVNRVPPDENPGGSKKQSHYTAGVEVELIDGGDDYTSGKVLGDGNPFVDPDKVNAVGTSDKPITVTTNRLRYRVRFRYPGDGEGDTKATGNKDDKTGQFQVDPTKQYLLD